MTIAAILGSISQHRFATYQSSVFNGATPEECLGIYLWNKQLAGAFLPALQVIEVSLRNAICGAKQDFEEDEVERLHPQPTWAQRKGNIDDKWFVTVMTQANNIKSYRAIAAAKSQLNNDGKPHTTENLISKLTLGFWVSLVDKKYDRTHANYCNYLSLWPDLTTRVFPHANKNGKALTINRIGSDLRDINTLRNRISHHEPLWRSDKTYSVEQAINKVAREYHRCIEVIRWINPSNLKLLSIIENTQKVNELCSPHSLWKNKRLPAGLSELDIISGEQWLGNTLLETRHAGVIVNINLASQIVMIQSEKDRQTFTAFASAFVGGMNAYSLHDRVSFEPEQSTQQGGQPIATVVKKA
ncbi:TPA: Abi family protein [Serratia marcescens]|nr:hypothetical protein SMKC034_44080 [Serratia marcescens]